MWIDRKLFGAKKISLVGDAISHSVLPGIAIAYMIAGSRSDLAMFIGALIAGIFTTLIIELIHSRSKIKKDAAIGITFTTMFAVGVILVSLYGADTDLDLDYVLFGKLDFMASKEKVFLGFSDCFNHGVHSNFNYSSNRIIL